MTTPTNMHAIHRTNQLGEIFIGTCSLCGEENLPMEAMQTECANQRGITQDEALIETLDRNAPEIDYKAHAEFLFQLLDDIDTAEDMAKANDKAFRNMVHKIHRKRFDVADTDGHSVTFK